MTPMTETLNAYEVVRPGTDPMAPGECVATELGNQSVGRAIAVTDPALGALVPPFRLK
jgi:hypothetical protein